MPTMGPGCPTLGPPCEAATLLPSNKRGTRGLPKGSCLARGRAATQAQAWVLPGGTNRREPHAALRTLDPGSRRRQEDKELGGMDMGKGWIARESTFLSLCNRAAALTSLVYGCLGVGGGMKWQNLGTVH